MWTTINQVHHDHDIYLPLNRKIIIKGENDIFLNKYIILLLNVIMFHIFIHIIRK